MRGGVLSLPPSPGGRQWGLTTRESGGGWGGLTCRAPKASWLSSAEEKLTQGDPVPSTHVTVVRGWPGGWGAQGSPVALCRGGVNFGSAPSPPPRGHPHPGARRLRGLSPPGAAGFSAAHPPGKVATEQTSPQVDGHAGPQSAPVCLSLPPAPHRALFTRFQGSSLDR